MKPISQVFKSSRLGFLAASAVTLLFGASGHQAANAQDPIYTVTHSFNSYADGAQNETEVVKASDGTLYGATWAGGTNNDGTIFAYSSSGVYTTIHSFTGNPDGTNPIGRLVIGTDGNLYGTTYNGGTSNQGIVFEITIGSGSPHTYAYQTIYQFTGAVGSTPEGGLTQASDGYIYGTATSGGPYNYGSIFRFKPVPTPTVALYYGFTNGSPNADGNDPRAGVIEANDHNLYGTTWSGGTDNDGTVYEINETAGTPTLTTTHNFANNPDGANPEYGGLYQGTDHNLYGTTYNGGTSSLGSVFLIGTGTSPTYKTLVSFNNSGIPGYRPDCRLAPGADGRLYGTTTSGGANNDGSIFAITLGTSSTFSAVYSFANTTDGNNPSGSLAVGADGQLYGATYFGGSSAIGATSRNLGVFYKISGSSTFTFTPVFQYTDGFYDGYNSNSKLVFGANKTYYGVTPYGGYQNDGVVYTVSPTGVYTVIHHFGDGTSPGDGYHPDSGLLLAADGNFYGTTQYGGSFGDGTVFKITPTGTLSTIYNFPGNGSGNQPVGVLIQGKGSDTNLYGTTYYGGSSNDGTAFKITTAGAITYLHTFTGGTDGANPNGALVVGSDGLLYGVTTYGGAIPAGASNDGTFFQLSTAGDGTTYNDYPFNGTNANRPQSDLVEVAPLVFWGTSEYGGTYGDGNIFNVSSTGTITSVYSVNGVNGYNINTGLVYGSDGNFYGNSYQGGYNNYGTVIKYDPIANVLTPLHTFYGADGANPNGKLIQGTDGNLWGTTYNGGSNGAGVVFNINYFIPYITGFSATNVGEGATITVNGAHFTGTNSVTFGTTPATFTVLKDNQVAVVVPIGATSQTISITTPHGTASHSGLTFKTTPAAAITSFSPASGGVGQVVVLTGQYFTGTTKVAFGGADGAAASYVVNSDTQLTAVIPSGATTGVIVVFTASGPGDSLTPFTVLSSPAPSIASFTPATGPIGTLVSITGANFVSVSSVKFHGTSASFNVVNENTIVALVPTGATTGTITVATVDGTATSAASYTVATPTVTLTSFSPTSGPVGTLVVLTGSGFTGATSVTFSGIAAQFAVNSDTSITATVPAGAKTGTIKVTTASGSATSSTSFIVPTTITSFTPASGAVGASVTITGGGFTGTTSVKFNGVVASFTVNSDTSITATVPSGATTGKIAVVSPSGSATSATSFTVS